MRWLHWYHASHISTICHWLMADLKCDSTLINESFNKRMICHLGVVFFLTRNIIPNIMNRLKWVWPRFVFFLRRKYASNWTNWLIAFTKLILSYEVIFSVFVILKLIWIWQWRDDTERKRKTNQIYLNFGVKNNWNKLTEKLFDEVLHKSKQIFARKKKCKIK